MLFFLLHINEILNNSFLLSGYMCVCVCLFVNFQKWKKALVRSHVILFIWLVDYAPRGRRRVDSTLCMVM